VPPILERVDGLRAAGFDLVNASLEPFNWRLTFCSARGRVASEGGPII
jgi:hypothetical protein